MSKRISPISEINALRGWVLCNLLRYPHLQSYQSIAHHHCIESFSYLHLKLFFVNIAFNMVFIRTAVCLYSQTDLKTKKVWQGKMFSWVTIPIWDWTRKGQHILVSIPMIQFWLLNLDNRYWIKESELKGLVKEEKQ